MRLLACISHHGYGHLAQSAPVLNQLVALRPDIRLVVRSALPRERLATRLQVPFEHHPVPMDCGFPMLDALRIDMPAALAAYGAIHWDWNRRLDDETHWLAGAGIEGVFSNVAYLPLAAAKRAGVPAAALCSLNWADIFRHYLPQLARLDESHAAEIAQWEAHMRLAYQSADVFLRPTPAMVMEDLSNQREVAPIATLGRRDVETLRSNLEARPGKRLVLVGMGGIGYQPPVEHWPELSDVLWLVPDEWPARRADMRPLSAAGMSFIDILASCDALITKPGYGSFTEAVAHGVPVLYLPRPEWPESPVLEAWLHAYAHAQCIDEADLRYGRLSASLEQLWRRPPPPSPECSGALEAARHLATVFA